MLFTELPLVDRPAAARDAGFAAVESWWPSEETHAWADAVERAGIPVALLNANAGDLTAGERGFLNIAERQEHELARIVEALALAARVGCQCVNVLVGRLTDERAHRAQREAAIDVLHAAAPKAAERQITLVIEPLNALDVPGYLLSTATDARSFIESVGSKSVRLLYDAYHAARSGMDPVQEAPRFVDLIQHVQYADHPGRGAPGTGTIDLKRFEGSLREAGYDRPIGLEFDPAGDTLAALASVPLLRTSTGFGIRSRSR